MRATQHLLDDEQMRRYLTEGYLVLKSSRPAGFHQAIHARTEELFAREGNPGNNILPRIPALARVFDDPPIRGALTSVLGPGYIMHSHRHCHLNPPHSQGGGWHKDSYWGYHKVRSHRTRWAMIFYYPQEVPLDKGPTGLMPGTQYYEARAAGEEGEVHLPLCGEAGTAVLVHFDLWHRAYPNTTECNRYMMKFQFTRMTEPLAPSWRGGRGAWPGGSEEEEIRHPALCSWLWDWHQGVQGRPPSLEKRARPEEWRGRLKEGEKAERLEAGRALGAMGAGAAPALDALVEALGDELEPLRLDAAYALAGVGAPAVEALVERLGDSDEAARLAAAHALAGVGAPAAAALSRALAHRAESVRGYAAYALGDMGAAAGDEAVEALAGRVDDAAEWVRRHVAEALGTLGRRPARTLPPLIALLRDRDAQVRFNAAYSLARLGAGAAPALDALVQALDDENRYVRNHSIEALKAIGTPQAQQVLLDFLATSRWCPLTSKESTF